MASDSVISVSRIADQAAAEMRAAIENATFDRELVTRAFDMQLAALRLPPRPILFYPNLNSASKRVVELVISKTAARVTARSAAWETARSAVWDAAMSAGWNAAPPAAWDVAWSAARDAARAAVWSRARETACEAAWAAARDATAARVAAWDVAWDVAKFAARVAASHTASDAARAAAWDAARAAALNSALAPDEAFIVVARSFLDVFRGGAFIFWIVPDAVHVVLARIRIADHRLHCDSAPAIEYEDHSGLYYWKGVQVPASVITAPGQLEVKGILRESNAEVRRVMIERYGLDRFVLDACAKRLDQWKDNELLAVDLPEDPDRRLVALKLRCPSTSAVYIIRVPPDQKTVRGALAWSFGLDSGEDYLLQEES